MKKLTSLILAASIFAATFVPASAQTRFADADGHWAEKYVVELASADILHGYPNGTVKPNQAITQGEFAALLVQSAGLETAEQNSAWYLPFANALRENGVADEISPNEPITRLKLVEWALRSMDGEKLTASKMSDFADLGGLTETEKNMVAEADEIGLISGYPDGTFRPNSICTRAKAFVILCGYPAASEQVKSRLKPVTSSGATQQMSVSLDAPTTAETYSPVEVKVVSQNVQSLDWTVSGYQDEIFVTAESFESNLSENGGEITFFQPGCYTLTAVAKSANGQTSEYVLTISVTEQPIRLSAPSEMPIYSDTEISAFVRSDITDLAWSVTRDGDDVSDEFAENLSETGGIVMFTTDGIYKFTLTGKNGLGEAVSASCEVLAFQQYYGCVTGSQTAFVGEDAYYGTSHFYLPESVHAEWQVLENGEILEWDSIVNGTIDSCYGGTVRFKRTGDFVVRLSVTDRLNHVTNSDVNTAVYEPIDFTLSVPDTVYVGEKIHASVSGLDEKYEPSWSAYGATIENSDRFGCDLTYNSVGTYRLTVSVPHEKGVTYTKYADVKVTTKPIVLSAEKEVALYLDFAITRTVRKDVTDLRWTVKKDSTEWTEIDPSSTFCFENCGRYEFTLSGTDGDGNAVSDTCEVLAYQPVYGWFYGAETSYLGDSAEYYISEFWLAEGMTAEWQVLENGEILEWNAVIDGELDTVGGTVKFKRTGKFEIQLVVTDWVGHTTTMSVETEVLPMPYLPEPTFTLPEIAYTQTAFVPSVTADLGPYEIAWSFTDESGKSVRNFSVEGGAIIANAAGNYIVTASISDGVGHTKSHSETLVVREKPHIRMNPLDRVTMEERLDYVCNLHLGTSDTSYPTFTNTDGMAVKFELFENGEPASDDAAYFTPRANSYTFQPKRVGDFTVRATATDEFGNSFAFETKYHAVPVVAAEITGLNDTVTINQTLAVGVTQHNMNGEAVTWKLAKISEDDADMTYGLSNLWLTSDVCQEVEFNSVCTANLTDFGGEITFFQPGIYCLRTEVTDQYGTTTERYKVMKVE